MKLDGYVRVSRVGGRSGDSFISPDVQRERIAAVAKSGGHRVMRVHEDLDLPGTHSDRPGLQAAMERVERGTVEGIIVARLDRFGRSSIDIHRNVERLREGKGELLTAAEGINTSTTMGRFFLSICAAFAELEIERITESWNAARERAVDRGVHISGHTPIGYRRRADRRLEKDRETAWAVQQAFGMRAGGFSWKRIADWLTEEGIPTTHKAPMWTIATTRSMIRNRVYLGEARSGKLSKPGAHPALVNEDVWLAANQARGARHAPTGSTAGLLSGIIRCAGCSFALKPMIGKTRHGKTRREYRCRPDKAAGRCPAPASVSSVPVEEYVVERFFEAYGEIYARFHVRSSERAQMESELAVARGELEAALDERLADALGGESAPQYIATVQRRREAVEAAEDRLASLDDGPVDLPEPARLAEVWDELELMERRELIGAAYSAIFLRRARSPRESAVDRLRFFETDDVVPPLPIRGRRGEIRSVEVD